MTRRKARTTQPTLAATTTSNQQRNKDLAYDTCPAGYLCPCLNDKTGSLLAARSPLALVTFGYSPANKAQSTAAFSGDHTWLPTILPSGNSRPASKHHVVPSPGTVNAASTPRTVYV